MKNPTTASEFNPIQMDDTRASSIEVSIPPSEGKKIIKLLERHSVMREDDTAERAATRLASMALTLANIASGHLRVMSDGIDHDLAVDFIVEGGITAADFTNSVIGSVEWIQGRCERNLLYDVAPNSAGQQKDPQLIAIQNLQNQYEALVLPVPAAKRMFAVGHNNFQNALKESENKARSTGRMALYSTEEAKESCKKYLAHRHIGQLLVTKRQDTLLREALEYPLFFVRATTPAGLRGHTSRAHLGRQMVYAEMDSANTLEAMRNEVANIGAKNSQGAPAVRVNLCLSAVTGILDEVVAAGAYQQTSIPNLLWLVESSAGCDLPKIEAVSSIDSRPDFRKACLAEIKRRISFHDEDIYHLESLDGIMSKWRLFLLEQERHLPGISRVAYNLPVALGYGLEVLYSRKMEIDGSGVLAWSKWLVVRMLNRVAAARAMNRDSRAEQLAMKLAQKLSEDGPMSVRDLSRRISRLKAGDCRKALNLLSEKGIAREQDGVWGILGNKSIASELKVTNRKAG